MMTRDEMVTFVTSKVGQTDSASVALCVGFVQRRYQMVYDLRAWRDTQMIATAATIAAQQHVDYPANVDRVIAIRCNNTFLDPVNSTFLIETDPGIFERTGVPSVYEEATDLPAGVDTKRIKLYPKPDAIYPLLIVGKRQRPELSSGSAKAIIRNIDDTIIAYAMGDMYERMRQLGKAREKFTEAAASLEGAWKLEQEQANPPRRAKNLTVSGNSLDEMTDSVAARAGTWGLNDRILIKDLLRRNYQTVYTSRLWRESLVVISAPSDGVQLILPEYVDAVVSVRADEKLGELIPSDINVLFGISPQIFEETTGSQVTYSLLAPVAVKRLSPTAEKLTLTSTDASDKVDVFIRGESLGNELTETVRLNGTTGVQSANVYDVPLTISKPTTLGDVTVEGFTSGWDLERILAAETERKHLRLWLQPGNTEGKACLVLAKRRIKPLQTDQDTPMLRDIQGVLIDMTTADMFLKLGNASGATATQSKADANFKRLIELETKQAGNVQRIFPSVESSWNYDDMRLSKAV